MLLFPLIKFNHTSEDYKEFGNSVLGGKYVFKAKL